MLIKHKTNATTSQKPDDRFFIESLLLEKNDSSCVSLIY